MNNDRYTKEQMWFLMDLRNQPCLHCGLTLRFCTCRIFICETDPKALNQEWEDWKKESKELQ